MNAQHQSIDELADPTEGLLNRSGGRKEASVPAAQLPRPAPQSCCLAEDLLE